MSISCAQCGQPIESIDARTPCPSCGSFNRRVEVRATFTLTAHEKLRAREWFGQKRGKWKRQTEMGDDLHRGTGVWNKLKRIIDRKHDRYYERIEDDQGHVLRECDEPLSQHIGHGSAKFSKGQKT